MNNSFRIGIDTTSLRIEFKKDINCTIRIHDPNYYMFTNNPETVPQIRIVVDSPTTAVAYITPVYHVNLDKPGSPCQTFESYSFTACIKNSLSSKIGCRLTWDTWSSKTIPLCGTSEQLLQFEKMYEMIDTIEMKSIIKITGCLPPCSYTEYRLTSVYKKGNIPAVVLRLTGSNVRKIVDKFIYPLESFVSEFGGAMGLFLGFSFIMMWDLLAASVSLSYYYVTITYRKIF